MNRVQCSPPAPVPRRGNVDFDATLHFIVGLDRPQDAAHRIGERAVQQVLKLGMSENWKNFWGQLQVANPSFGNN